MVKKFKELLNKGESKKILSNFMSLSFLQGANLILPLITFPYLVRVLGVEYYGLVFFAQAFIAYFALISDYGFNLSGTREISLCKNNIQKLTRTYNSILLARLGLTFFGFVLMAIIVLSIGRFQKDWELYFLTYGLVIGNTLFPIWFFQGMEKMKFITILNLISKTIFTISIFIFVKSPKDYLWVPVLTSIGYVISGIISLIIINKQFKISFELQKSKYIFQQLKNGWYIFISKISTNFYTATTTFVLGLVTNNTMVGYYTIAEKVVRIIISVFAPFIQAIYPHIVQLTKKSESEAASFIKKVLKYTLLISITIWISAIPLASPMFHLIFNKEVEYSIKLFRILSPLIIIIPTASILFNLVLLSFKMDKYFSRIYLTGAILNIILLIVFLFILKLSAVGAAISLLICETIITLYAIILIHKKGIKIFSFIKPLILIKSIK